KMLATLLVVLMVSLQGASAADWLEPACSRRLALQLPPAEKSTPAALIVTGREFWNWTGFPRPRTDTFRLYQGTKVLAYQVEERQASGLPASPDGFFDDPDLLLFVATLGPEKKSVCLYYDGPASQPLPAELQPQVTEKKGDLIPLWLSAGQLKVGLRGGGTEDHRHDIQNFGRGSFVFLSWKGQILIDFRSSWGNYLPRGLASDREGPVWSEPEIIQHGPVRTLVAVRCSNYVARKDNREILTASIVRLLSLWHSCPVLDGEEYVDYHSQAFDWSWPYSFSLPVGKSLDQNDVLIVPLAGRAYTRRLNRTRQEIEASPWENLYATDNPEEGWFAWQDTVEKTGLAVFYEKMATLAQRAAWVSYRPPLHPRIQLRTTPYPSVENNLSFVDRALACRSHYSRQWRYLLLEDEAPETIHTLYHLWAGQPGSLLTASSPEKKGNEP
ncbi:MAG TPA: hypothetical protein PKW42_06650, partial [bacterium]|nr:hypothetical protein [bacterium]